MSTQTQIGATFEEALANAARIAECVDACEGLPTDELQYSFLGWKRDIADLRAQNAELLAALEQGYLLVLMIPYSIERGLNQQTLCAMRDAIAAATGRTSEDVQDDFESRATIACAAIAKAQRGRS